MFLELGEQTRFCSRLSNVAQRIADMRKEPLEKKVVATVLSF